MTARTRRGAAGILCFGLGLFCWLYALRLASDWERLAGTASLRFQGELLTASQVESALEDDELAYNFAAWRELASQTISEKEWERETQAIILEAAGDISLMLPRPLIAGAYPSSAGTAAIDSLTAYALWGDPSGGLGSTILYDGKDYLITGIFDYPEKAVVIQSPLAEDTSFPFVELAVTSASSAQQQAERFISGSGFPSAAVTTSRSSQVALYRAAATLPAWIPCLALLFSTISLLEIKARWIRWTARGAGIFLTAKLLGFSLPIPDSFIPTQWSDFSFWSALAESLSRQALLQRTLPSPLIDMVMESLYADRIAGAAVIAAAAFMTAILLARQYLSQSE